MRESRGARAGTSRALEERSAAARLVPPPSPLRCAFFLSEHDRADAARRSRRMSGERPVGEQATRFAVALVACADENGARLLRVARHADAVVEALARRDARHRVAAV